MTVASNDRFISYAGDGATKGFAFDFPVSSGSDIIVTVRDANNVYTQKTLTTDYAVARTVNGGTVTFVTAPAATDTIFIESETVIEQTTDFVNGERLPAQGIENTLDRQARVLQEMRTKGDRAITVPPGEVAPVLPRGFDFNDISELGDRLAEIDSLAAIVEEIVILADPAYKADIEELTEASYKLSIQTVAAADAQVRAVGDDLDGTNYIGTVAGDLTTNNYVGTVGADLQGSNFIGAVGASIDNVNTVAINIGNVNIAAATVAAVDESAILGRASAGTGAVQQLPPSTARAVLELTDAKTYADALGSVSEGVLLGRSSSGAGVFEEITASTGRTLLNLAETYTKAGLITVTQPINLDTVSDAIAGTTGAFVFKGEWDASSGVFPGGGTAQTGFTYLVSVSGTVDGVSFAVNDRISALVNNASTTTYAGNWLKQDYSPDVLSVAGRTGAVTLTFTDIGSTIALTQIADGLLTTAKYGNGSMTEVKIANAAITEPKLANSSVTSTKLAGGSVTEAKIANNAVTVNRIAAGAVTLVKIAAGVLDIDNFAGLSLPLDDEADLANVLSANLKVGMYVPTKDAREYELLSTGPNVWAETQRSIKVSRAEQSGLAAQSALTRTALTGVYAANHNPNPGTLTLQTNANFGGWDFYDAVSNVGLVDTLAFYGLPVGATYLEITLYKRTSGETGAPGTGTDTVVHETFTVPIDNAAITTHTVPIRIALPKPFVVDATKDIHGAIRAFNDSGTIVQFGRGRLNNTGAQTYYWNISAGRWDPTTSNFSVRFELYRASRSQPQDRQRVLIEGAGNSVYVSRGQAKVNFPAFRVTIDGTTTAFTPTNGVTYPLALSTDSTEYIYYANLADQTVAVATAATAPLPSEQVIHLGTSRNSGFVPLQSWKVRDEAELDQARDVLALNETLDHSRGFDTFFEDSEIIVDGTAYQHVTAPTGHVSSYTGATNAKYDLSHMPIGTSLEIVALNSGVQVYAGQGKVFNGTSNKVLSMASGDAVRISATANRRIIYPSNGVTPSLGTTSDIVMDNFLPVGGQSVGVQFTTWGGVGGFHAGLRNGSWVATAIDESFYIGQGATGGSSVTSLTGLSSAQTWWNVGTASPEGALTTFLNMLSAADSAGQATPGYCWFPIGQTDAEQIQNGVITKTNFKDALLATLTHIRSAGADASGLQFILCPVGGLTSVAKPLIKGSTAVRQAIVELANATAWIHLGPEEYDLLRATSDYHPVKAAQWTLGYRLARHWANLAKTQSNNLGPTWSAALTDNDYSVDVTITSSGSRLMPAEVGALVAGPYPAGFMGIPAGEDAGTMTAPIAFSHAKVTGANRIELYADRDLTGVTLTNVPGGFNWHLQRQFIRDYWGHGRSQGLPLRTDFQVL